MQPACAWRCVLTVLVVVTALLSNLTKADEEIMSDELYHRTRRQLKKELEQTHNSFGELRIVSVPTEPYLFVDKISVGSEPETTSKHVSSLHPSKSATVNADGTVNIYSGFVADLVYELSRRLKFTYKIYLTPDGAFGTKKENGVYTGLIGEIIKNENNASDGAHIAAAPITITADRENVVDFVTAFQNLGLSVMIKKPWGTAEDPPSIWSINFGIFAPITADLWVFVVFAFIAIGCLLWLTNKYNPYEWSSLQERGLATVEEGSTFSLAGSLWFTFTTLQWQGFERIPRSLGGKLLACVWFLFVLLFLITYTGSLLNHLFWASAVQSKTSRQLYINGLDDLVRHNYTFGCVKGGSTHRYLMDVAEGDEFDKIRSYLQTEEGQQSLVKNVTEGVERVRKGNFAFIGETMALKHEANKLPCDVMTVGDQFAVRSYGMAVARDSPLLEPLHVAMLQLIQEGVIVDLERKWWTDRGQCYAHSVSDNTIEDALTIAAVEPQRVGLAMFWQPVVLLVVGILIAALVSVAETIYFRKRGWNQPSNRPKSEPLTNEMSASKQELNS